MSRYSKVDTTRQWMYTVCWKRGRRREEKTEGCCSSSHTYIDIWSVSMILQKMLIRLTCIAPIHTRISRARWRQKEKASYWFRLRDSKMSLTVFSCMSLNATKLANHISGANVQLSQRMCTIYTLYCSDALYCAMMHRPEMMKIKKAINCFFLLYCCEKTKQNKNKSVVIIADVHQF